MYNLEAGAFFAHHLPQEDAISRPGRPFSNAREAVLSWQHDLRSASLSQNLLSGGTKMMATTTTTSQAEIGIKTLVIFNIFWSFRLLFSFNAMMKENMYIEAERPHRRWQ